MNSDYIPRLRQELLRAGATKPARFRWDRVVSPLRPLAVAVAVALLVVAIVRVLPDSGRGERVAPAGQTVRLEYHVEPARAAEATAQTMRARLAAAGIEGAGVTVSSTAVLTITAPDAARADVAALTQPGRLAMYDWEASVLGPRGKPAPNDARVTGGPDAGGRAAALSRGEAEARASGRPGARVVRAERSDGWFALGGTPALTNAEIKDPEVAKDVPTDQPIVTFTFTESGQQAFSTLTREVAQRGNDRGAPGVSDMESWQHFVIVIDDRIASTPFIDGRMNPEGIDGADGAQIAGDFTPETARQLAAILNSGPLPGTLSTP